MVCLTQFDQPAVMSTPRTREVVATCNRGQARMQAVADLLLLTSDSRPVATESLSSFFGGSFPKCRETIVTRSKGLLVLTGKINEHLHSVSSQWHDVSVCLQDICELVVGITECSAHASYLISVSKPQCVSAVPGIIDQYKICRANVEIDLSCKQISQSAVEDLTPQYLVQICSDINKNLTILTECCKYASENASDGFSQDQFKLCIKSFTSCASCLLSSIKCFKTYPTETHQLRCIGFCESLRQSTQAAVNFATEDQFIGKPAILTTESKDAKKAVLGVLLAGLDSGNTLLPFLLRIMHFENSKGGCLGIGASCIQLCRTIKDLAYDNKNIGQRDRISMCTDSILRASSQLATALRQHNVSDTVSQKLISQYFPQR